MIEPLAYSICHFAVRHGISRTAVYQLLRTGELASFRVGRRRLISAEAAAEWRRRCEAEAAQEQA